MLQPNETSTYEGIEQSKNGPGKSDKTKNKKELRAPDPNAVIQSKPQVQVNPNTPTKSIEISYSQRKHKKKIANTPCAFPAKLILTPNLQFPYAVVAAVHALADAAALAVAATASVVRLVRPSTPASRHAHHNRSGHHHLLHL